MAWFSKLFGGKSADAGEAAAPDSSEEYKGFRITAKPIREGGQYRVAARIVKDDRVHELVRADTVSSLDDATAISLGKARQVIDEQGEKLFG
jgi:hypothetical protein